MVELLVVMLRRLLAFPLRVEHLPDGAHPRTHAAGTGNKLNLVQSKDGDYGIKERSTPLICVLDLSESLCVYL